MRFQSVQKTLRRTEAHTYSDGIDAHSLRKKTSYARYLPSYNILKERIIDIEQYPHIQVIL